MVYCIVLPSSAKVPLLLGFSPKRLKISGAKPSRNANQFIKISKIENNNLLTPLKRYFNGDSRAETIKFLNQTIVRLIFVMLKKLVINYQSYFLFMS